MIANNQIRIEPRGKESARQILKASLASAFESDSGRDSVVIRGAQDAV